MYSQSPGILSRVDNDACNDDLGEGSYAEICYSAEYPIPARLNEQQRPVGVTSQREGRVVVKKDQRCGNMTEPAALEARQIRSCLVSSQVIYYRYITGHPNHKEKS